MLRRGLLLFAPALLFAQAPPGHWVETWTAAQQIARGFQARAPSSAAGAFANQTIRMIAHTSIGGRRLRIELSNTYNPEPLGIGAAHVAVRAKDSAIIPASDRALTVNGKTSFTIPPGALILTDPVDLDFPALSDLAISLFIPGSAPPLTQHSLGLHTTWISPEGNFTYAPSIDASRTSQTCYWLSGIQVLAPAGTAAIVAFGDSITDGFHSTADADRMWPAVLAKRLAPLHLAVVNEGISGNQLLQDGAGVNALSRFDRDVLSLAGVKWVVILEGINDIGRRLAENAGPGGLTVDDLIAANKQMIDRAHVHGIKVAGATLTPYEGASYSSDKGELVRDALNEWIRTSHAYDAVIDFDAATRDPAHPTQLRPDFDSGDHLHPNDAGYKAMADSIDLSIFGK